MEERQVQIVFNCALFKAANVVQSHAHSSCVRVCSIRPELKTSLYLERCSWNATPKQPTDTTSDDTKESASQEAQNKLDQVGLRVVAR